MAKAGKNKTKLGKLGAYLKSKSFYRLLIGLITIIVAFTLVENGAAPKKYKLALGDKSPYDIVSPRDIVNTVLTEEKASAAADRIPSVIVRLEAIPLDVLNKADDFFTKIETARKSISKSLEDQGITKRSSNYSEKLEIEQSYALSNLKKDLAAFNAPLTDEQMRYLLTKATDAELQNFEKIFKDAVSFIMKEEITDDNLPKMINSADNLIQNADIKQELKNTGSLLIKAIMIPNSVIDEDATAKKKKEAYENALVNKEIIRKDARIISYGDIVTADKLAVLDELSLLETGGFDYTFAAGLLVVLLLLTTLLIIYMNYFFKKILNSTNDLILLSVIIIITLVAAWAIYPVSPLAIPIFIAPMLISILIDLRFAIAVNLVLTLSISFITKGDAGFIYMAIISGSFSAFIVSRANQRSKLSAAGLAVAGVNALISVCVGVLQKTGFTDVANNCLIASLNGIVSIIFTIGILPFFESTFGIITPLKLLELANPNQPLIKRLLMEAPGTYHHSLMVGNLAEVACEAIDGNALLARVGAFYHDIGKLKRPNFFKENQLSGNPHDKMTPNLSTLVITSHTSDGVELAESYKIPVQVRDIIKQHHGSTLVAYFYYKAQKGEKGDSVKQEDFRYTGPKPKTKEAAVVMLADSVEAAVRSAAEKTEGKIEGLIRKIIKDKLDDGQLDLCSLTLKDLNTIANSFLRVFSGYFHEREEYPEIKIKKDEAPDTEIKEPAKQLLESKGVQEGATTFDGYFD